jgi:hypothetical protein
VPLRSGGARHRAQVYAVAVGLVQSGDRFRVVRDVESHVELGGYAPAHTAGVDCVVPAGTVVIAHDQAPGAIAFRCYPEAYDAMEKVLIPEKEREGFRTQGFMV